jgi:hypothetical protein
MWNIFSLLYDTMRTSKEGWRDPNPRCLLVEKLDFDVIAQGNGLPCRETNGEAWSRHTNPIKRELNLEPVTRKTLVDTRLEDDLFVGPLADDELRHWRQL